MIQSIIVNCFIPVLLRYVTRKVTWMEWIERNVNYRRNYLLSKEETMVEQFIKFIYLQSRLIINLCSNKDTFLQLLSV